jgi:hypothetical protein
LHPILPHHERNVLLRAINIQHGTPDFTSLLKEVVLWIFIALKNPSTSAKIEPTNFGPNGKRITTRPARQEKVTDTSIISQTCTNVKQAGRKYKNHDKYQFKNL